MVSKLSGKKLREKRKEREFTQEQLAEHSGISDRHLRNLETETVEPSASVLYQISRALDTPMDEFMVILDEERQET